MLNSFNFTDTYDCEKLRLLQSMNDQIELMAIKLDQIVSHVEENQFKIQQNNRNVSSNNFNSIKTNNQENRPNFCNSNNGHMLVTINNDQLITNLKEEKVVPTKKAKANTSNLLTPKIEHGLSEPKTRPPDTTAKRNKQQRQFNTFVRDSINQLLGNDFMRTHDVQDIDSQVMEMIRKEAVENYLPDNIRPRRAWHLAKASLRTLKRTLNNRK